MTVDSTPDDQTFVVRPRPRPRPRQINLTPEVHRPPPPPEKFMTAGPEDKYEFASNPLPNDVNMQAIEISRFSRGAAIEDRHKLMRPLMARGATSTEIARLFGCSIVTAERWKREYREWVKSHAVDVDALQEYAEHRDRMNLMTATVMNELLRTVENETTMGQTARKLRVVRTLNELERTRMAVNQAYGLAYDGVLEKEKLKMGSVKNGDSLLDMVRDFAGIFDMSEEVSLSDLDNLTGSPNAIDSQK